MSDGRSSSWRFASAIVVLLLLTRSAAAQNAPGGALLSVPASLDLGEWAAGKQTGGSLWLINASARPVRLTGASSSSRAVAVGGFSPITLQPSQAAEFGVSVVVPSGVGQQLAETVRFAREAGPPLEVPVLVHAIHPDLHLPSPWVDDQSASRLRTAPARLRLGEVAPDRQKSGTVWLINASSAPLQVLAAKGSCGCLEIDGFNPMTLAPRQAVPVQVKLYAAPAPKQERIKFATFIVEGQDPLVLPVHLVTIDAKLARLKELLAAVKRGDTAAAKIVRSVDSRIWYGTKDGPGLPRDANGAGPWDRFSRAVGTRRYHQDFQVKSDEIVAVVEETTDVHRRCGMPPTILEVTYFFNDDREVTGVLEEQTPFERARGVLLSCPAFLEWLEQNHPDVRSSLELDAPALSPGAADRLATLLAEWNRSAAPLGSIATD